MEPGFVPASPVRDGDNAPFFDAAKEGKLLIKQCNACNEPFFYPRDNCPFCLSGDTKWVEASGEGVIYSHTEVAMKGNSYVLGVVTLAEGPTMMTNIVSDEPGKLEVGQKVRVQFMDTAGEEKLAIFVPA